MRRRLAVVSIEVGGGKVRHITTTNDYPRDKFLRLARRERVLMAWKGLLAWVWERVELS